MLQTRKAKWRKLENAAKIFPATANDRDERVFRMACELNEDVNAEALQQALDKTMTSFALFSCVMRKGVFWYYLEESTLRPIVREEYRAPCSRLYYPDEKTLLFEVTYYKRRINLEVFHALADGTGTLQFLRTLIVRYLTITHPNEVEPLVQPQLDVSVNGEDGFEKYYSKEKAAEKIPEYKAYQMPKSNRFDAGEMRIVEGVAPVDKMLAIAKEHGATLTAFLAAAFMCAIADDMRQRDKRKPVALMIPVNLRHFFPSESVRNFFAWIDMGYNFSRQPADFDSVVDFTAQFFKKEITKERMAARMNSYIGLETNALMRVVPLEIKMRAMQLGNYVSYGNDTAVFSNIGRIDLPKECAPFVKMFDFFTATGKMQLCVCSYGNNLTMTFTTVFKSVHVFRSFFRTLTKLGVPVEVAVRSEEENDAKL